MRSQTEHQHRNFEFVMQPGWFREEEAEMNDDFIEVFSRQGSSFVSITKTLFCN